MAPLSLEVGEYMRAGVRRHLLFEGWDDAHFDRSPPSVPPKGQKGRIS